MSLFDEYFVNIIKYRYADFEGRSRRREHWYFFLFYMLIFFGIYVMMFISILLESRAVALSFLIMAILFTLAVTVPALALATRRLHDIGKSAWHLLFGLIPGIGAIILLVYYCTDGEPGENIYGPNPKEVA